MKVIVSTHQGVLYNEDVNHVVVKNPDGEFAILKNHIPIISIVTEGYIKMVDNNQVLYVAVINGMVEYSNDTVNILAQEAQVGESFEKAILYLDNARLKRLEENKKKNIDYTATENQLKQNIKASKAGKIMG